MREIPYGTGQHAQHGNRNLHEYQRIAGDGDMHAKRQHSHVEFVLYGEQRNYEQQYIRHGNDPANLLTQTPGSLVLLGTSGDEVPRSLVIADDSLCSFPRYSHASELSMGPFCVTRPNLTHQLTDPTQPNPLQVKKFGPNPTQPNTNLTVIR